MHHLEGFFQDILDKGGEGIILRDPSAPYREGRSPGFLKHKVGVLLLPPPNTTTKLSFLRNTETPKRKSLGVSANTAGNVSCLMGSPLWRHRERRSLLSDGIHNQEISSASNIMAISSLPRNPNSPPSIASEQISHGMMLYIIGKNRNPPKMVIFKSSCVSKQGI